MVYGCEKEVIDKRDYKLKNVSTRVLPKEHTITMPDVKDQGFINSCVAHSLSTFMEEYHKSKNEKFSVGFIYGYRPLGYHQGEGMRPREALKTLQKIGDVPYVAFPYNEEVPGITIKVNNDLTNLTLIANKYKIKSYARIYTIDEIKTCLFNDCPVPISIPVYNYLELDTTNTVYLPEGDVQGYHMVILYGWNEHGFLMQNSWGEYWGNKGCAVLPYDYPIDSAWAISTDTNTIETKQTIWQKIWVFIINLLKKLH